MSRPAPGRGGVAPWGGVCLCLVAGCGRLNPYNGEDLPSRFTARPRVGGRHAAGRIFGFRLCVTARPRVGGRRAVVARRAMVSWWSSSWSTPYGGPVVLVCVVVRKGCVSVLTGCVIFGKLFWEKQVW